MKDMSLNEWAKCMEKRYEAYSRHCYAQGIDMCPLSQ